ncbi:thioredoxin-like protein [Lactarius psammicola]|nr:thioredoxin-like protein [Lactarius psammicola]
MVVIPITSLTQFNTVINADRVALIYFWAYWCGPCRGMTQIFNGFADSGSYPGVDFYRVDIDHAQDVVQHVGGQTMYLDIFPSLLVMCTQIPGFYAYRRGQKLGELIGAYPDGLQLYVAFGFYGAIQRRIRS